MSKVLKLNESILELVTRHPEAVDIMAGLGFHDITKPGMLQTAGRFMTLSKGMKLKRIELETVRLAFEQHGFGIIE
ncbi:DUF1858 domain-containing protein [Paenibacillus borealis]|uniref:DUF1858 domain-containing protein n=1 Tax=Paenibacillus borealis TaxID=160799 RepID=A0A089MGD4_PAEBO|nr:DUF1858 domain-containing protein [Paenibacillus borealis]AIQ55674.1 hypothetical protein PBOR_00820 [Paenibacillus borealis]